MENVKQHEIVHVIFKDNTKEPLHYPNAELSIEQATDSYIIKAIIDLPIEERDPENPDKKIPMKSFHVLERIARHEVLRIYTLDSCK